VTTFLTGATGFIGMEVLLRLAARGEPVLALVRGAGDEDAARRLAAALDLVGVPHEQRHLVAAVRGDLTAPGLGLSAAARERVVSEADAVVHGAASVSFALALEQARLINVTGTRRVLELARELHAGDRLRRVVHVSTAYVAGRTEGRFRERQLYAGQRFRNTYEQTKLEAEALLARAGAGLPLVIARPSIVVGESDTGWTPAFNVLYWPLRAFARGLLPVVPADPAARVDVVPVDHVADALVHLALDDRTTAGALHLAAGDDAATVGELVDLACAAFGRGRPAILDDHRVRQELAARSDEAARYLDYFRVRTVFDTARSRALLAPAGRVPPPLGNYFAALAAHAADARWGKALRPRPAVAA